MYICIYFHFLSTSLKQRQRQITLNIYSSNLLERRLPFDVRVESVQRLGAKGCVRMLIVKSVVSGGAAVVFSESYKCFSTCVATTAYRVRVCLYLFMNVSQTTQPNSICRQDFLVGMFPEFAIIFPYISFAFECCIKNYIKYVAIEYISMLFECKIIRSKPPLLVLLSRSQANEFF